LAAGRNALSVCLAAIIEFYTLFQQDNDSIANSICLYLSQLYKALRDGWVPVCRCWPKLMDIDRSKNWKAKSKRADESTQIAAIVWMEAKSCYWSVIDGFGCVRSALKAWDNWEETYSPELGESRSTQGISGPIRIFKRNADSAKPHKWHKLKEAIEQVIPAVAEDESTATRIEKPALPGPCMPLPGSRLELKRLLSRVDEYMERYTVLQNQLASKSFDELKADKAPFVDEDARCRSLASEFVYYADPISLALHGDVLFAARGRFRDLVQEAKGQKLGEGRTVAKDGIIGAWKEIVAAHRSILIPIGRLRRQILAKLAKIDRTSTSGKVNDDKWISASEAAKIADQFGVKLSLSAINKLSNKKPPPFLAKPRGGRGRDVNLGSFLLYLTELKRPKPGSDAELDDVAKRLEELRGDEDQEYSDDD
jgi:hypothetical protein